MSVILIHGSTGCRWPIRSCQPIWPIAHCDCQCQLCCEYYDNDSSWQYDTLHEKGPKLHLL